MPALSPASVPSAVLEAALKEHFGLDAFREGQRDVIDSLLAGRPTLAVMPTGRGKSLCYQLPALVLPGLTLVVSPLIALMKDQVDALQAKGIAATFINSSLEASEQQARVAGMVSGSYRLVYVAPERFRQRAFLDALAGVEVSLFAVDEAHCLSQWGHDFRPDYLKLKAAIAACGRPTVLAATATATPEVRDDIVAQLGLDNPRVVVSGFDRPNLRYVVRYAPNEETKLAKLAEILAKIPGSAVVYAATRKNVEAIAEHLQAHGERAVAYHAGLEDGERARAQNRFMGDEARVVVATNAFGMGIDKPDVRVVVHYDLPGTLEAYYQEAGRAGRDGRTSFCVLLFSPADRYLQEFFIEGGCPKPATIAGVYRVLVRQAEEEIFLSQEAINRQLPFKAHDMAIGTALNLLERYGLIERLAKGAAPAHVRLLQPDAQAPRSAVQQRLLDWLRQQPGVFDGMALDLQVLAREFEDVKEGVHHGLTALRQKGVLEYTPPARTRGIRVTKRLADPLAALDVGYLETKQTREVGKLDRMVGFAYTRGCRRNYVLNYFGEATSEPCGRCDGCNDQVDPALAGALATPQGPAGAGGGASAAERVNAGLYEALRALRARLAREQDLPAYMVFADKTLEVMADRMPDSADRLLAIHGVGPDKLVRFGDAFLGAIQAFRAAGVTAEGPTRPRGGAGPASRPKAPAPASSPTERRERARAQVTALYREGLALEQIAQRSMRSLSTVEELLLEAADAGLLDLSGALDPAMRRQIEAAIARVGRERPRAIAAELPDTIPYFAIKLVLHDGGRRGP